MHIQAAVTQELQTVPVEEFSMIHTHTVRGEYCVTEIIFEEL